jgi:3-oxo-4,17-pregnadiene-20-carboxyl-CoA hydratase alpha subunit
MSSAGKSSSTYYSATVGSLEQGRAFIGRPQPAQRGALTVDAGLIRLFCASVQDANEAYWSEDAAISPPALLYTWTFQLPWTPWAGNERVPALGVRVPLPGDQVANVHQSAEFYRRIRVGDRLTVTETVLDITDEKHTALGDGFFVTTEAQVHRQDGLLIARLHNTLLRYRSRPLT